MSIAGFQDAIHFLKQKPFGNRNPLAASYKYAFTRMDDAPASTGTHIIDHTLAPRPIKGFKLPIKGHIGNI
jgi:hypothetical protein